MSDYLRVLYRRALSSGDASLLQLAFDVAVLDRYRGTAGHALMRTDTVGRVHRPGGWTLDVGIAPGETQIHASWSALVALPQEEREHWAAHAAGPPASEMFVKMQLAPGSCFDDGELRPW